MFENESFLSYFRLLPSLTPTGFVHSWYTEGEKALVSRQLCLPVRIRFYETNAIWPWCVRIWLEHVLLILATAITDVKYDVPWRLLRGAQVISPKASFLNEGANQVKPNYYDYL